MYLEKEGSVKRGKKEDKKRWKEKIESHRKGKV